MKDFYKMERLTLRKNQLFPKKNTSSTIWTNYKAIRKAKAVCMRSSWSMDGFG